MSFESNGGSAVASQKLFKGEKVERPKDPVKSNYKFTAWFDTADLVREYDFDFIPTADLTLYAGWRYYGLVLSPISEGEELDLDALEAGYTAADINAQTVTVTNTTDGIIQITVSLSGANPNAFKIDPASFDLGAGESVDLSVYPVTGLAVGEYSAAAEISGGGYSLGFGMKFEVKPVPIPVVITLTVEQVKDIDFIPPVIPPLSRAALDSAAVSITLSDYDPGSVRWEITGFPSTAVTDVSSFTINAADPVYNALGGNSLILTVEVGGIQYQKNIGFMIVN